MSFRSLTEILEQSQQKKKPFWEIVVEDDMTMRQVSKESSFSKMNTMYQAMREADLSYDASLRSASGLVGGDGQKILEASKNKTLFCGDFLCRVMARAVKMGESNACMRRIVAAPTAGSCGVLPAVLLTCEEERNIPNKTMLESLFVAAGIGEVIAARAFISGAEGGCQAEIGSASAMAAGAVAYLNGGGNEEIVHASALALKNLLGLACDPIAGLVEVPCVKRNVIGAVNALSSADMALAGITSRIPPDQVIDAMKEVGESMHVSLRETGEGGVANTPEARKIKEKLGM